MADSEAALVKAFLKKTGLNKRDNVPNADYLEQCLTQALVALNQSDKPTADRNTQTVNECLDAAQLPDETIAKAKNAVQTFLKKNTKKQKKSRFKLSSAIAKAPGALKRAVGFARKGKKKETDKAVADLHKSLKAQGEIPGNMTLDMFYTDLGKIQSNINAMRKGPGGFEKAKAKTVKLEKLVKGMDFKKSRKMFNVKASPKALMDFREIALTISRRDVTNSETMMLVADVVVNDADTKTLSGHAKKDNLKLAQAIHDELNMEIEVENAI